MVIATRKRRMRDINGISTASEGVGTSGSMRASAQEPPSDDGDANGPDWQP